MLVCLCSMLIDDERDSDYDDNYHNITSVVVAPPVIYKAPASHMTFDF
jgi:hypothetical protein